LAAAGSPVAAMRAFRVVRDGAATQLENWTMDFVVLAIGAVFFALAFAYVAACDRL
jgi:hypothetical protein